jgi:hypothetical protein
LFSKLPISPVLAAATGSDWLKDYLLPIGVVLLIFLVPHIIAARLFTPKSNILLVLAACIMQVLFIILVAWIFFILAIGGWIYMVIGGLVVFIMSALVMTGIYRFEFVKGLGYNAFALLLIVGISWGLIKVHPETMYRRVGAPLAMHLIRFGASFQKSEEAAQREAVKNYPDLGVAGSEFNRRFLAKVAKYRSERPDDLRSPGWPVVVANDVGLDVLAEKFFKIPATPSSSAQQP